MPRSIALRSIASSLLPFALCASLCASCGDDGGAGGDGDAGIHLTPGSPAAGEPAGLSGITDLHNQARAMVVPTPSPAIPALTWSDTVAAAAAAWADTCTYGHSGNSYGENIYASAGFTPDALDVVSSWVSEAADYDYDSNRCSGDCGHYTQVVWRDTAQVGCAIKQCSTGSPFGGFSDWTIVVCDYSPPGNYGGRPY